MAPFCRRAAQPPNFCAIKWSKYQLMEFLYSMYFLDTGTNDQWSSLSTLHFTQKDSVLELKNVTNSHGKDKGMLLSLPSSAALPGVPSHQLGMQGWLCCTEGEGCSL